MYRPRRTPLSAEPLPASMPPANEMVDLMRQLLECSASQLAYHRAAAAAHDITARWRAFLARWQHEFL